LNTLRALPKEAAIGTANQRSPTTARCSPARFHHPPVEARSAGCRENGVRAKVAANVERQILEPRLDERGSRPVGYAAMRAAHCAAVLANPVRV